MAVAEQDVRRDPDDKDRDADAMLASGVADGRKDKVAPGKDQNKQRRQRKSAPVYAIAGGTESVFSSAMIPTKPAKGAT